MEPIYAADKIKGYRKAGALADGASVTIQLPPVLQSGGAAISFSLSAGTVAVSAGAYEDDLTAHADSPFSATNTIMYFAPGMFIKLTASGGAVDYTVTA